MTEQNLTLKFLRYLSYVTLTGLTLVYSSNCRETRYGKREKSVQDRSFTDLKLSRTANDGASQYNDTLFNGVLNCRVLSYDKTSLS